MENNQSSKTKASSPKLKQVMDLLKEIGDESQIEGNECTLFVFIAAELSNDDLHIQGGGDHESLVGLLRNARENEFIDGVLNCVESGGCVKGVDFAKAIKDEDIVKAFLNKKPTAQA